MIFEAFERLREAHAHVGRCADSAWVPRGDTDPYRLANQVIPIKFMYHNLLKILFTFITGVMDQRMAPPRAI